MRGKVAGDAEIAGGADNAVAENFLPESIDGNASRQRIFAGQQPLRQAEPILGKIGGHRRERGGC